MGRAQHFLRSTLICGIACVVVAALMSTVLPWLAEEGYAGEVIQYSYRNGRDATPLFYSESERTWELMKQVDGPPCR